MKKYILFLCVACIAAAFLTSFTSPKKLIVIDAGHGGHDYGAEMHGHTEKDIVVSIASTIKDHAGENVEIVLLRDSDKFMDLRSRVEAINKHNPSLVISLHVDAHINRKSTGITAFVAENNYYDKSFAEATRIIDAIANQTLKKGPVKSAPFFVLKNSKCPAVNLNLGNISSVQEREYIASREGQQEIGKSIAKAISE